MKKQSFLKGSFILMSMVIITKAIGLIYKLPLTHLLGGTGMGYYSSAFAVFTPVFAIIVSGIPSTIARIVAENYAFERYKNVRKIRTTALIIFSIIGLLVTIIFILISKSLATYVIKESNAKWALIGIAPSIFIAAILSVERGYFEGLKNMIPTAVSEIIETIFKLILGLGFALAVHQYAMNEFQSTGGCFGIFCKTEDEALIAALPYITGASVLGVSIATAIGCLYIIISGRIHGDGITKAMLKQDKYTDKFSVISKNLIKNCLPIAFATLISTLSNMLDLVTINSCLKKAMNLNPTLFSEYISRNLSREMIPNFIYGSYSGLALTIVGLIPTLTAMFGKSILPSLSEVWAKKDRYAISKSLSSMLLITFLVLIPCSLWAFIMPKEVLEFLFAGRTKEIALSILPMAILGIGIIFQGACIPVFSVLQTIGKANLPIIIAIAGGIIKLLGNIILISIPEININGAAISTVISDAVMCIWALIAMIKYSNIKWDCKKILIKPLFAGVLSAITLRLSYDVLYKYIGNCINFRIIMVFSVFLGSIMYLFSLHLLCVSPKNTFFSLFYKKNKKIP